MDKSIYVESIVEKTDLMEDRMSQIKMTMALGLGKQLGKTSVDMRLEQDECEKCVIHSVPHYHLIGYENGDC